MAPHSLSLSSATTPTIVYTLIPESLPSTFPAGPGCHFDGPFKVCDEKTALSEIATILGPLSVDQLTISTDPSVYEATHLPDRGEVVKQPQHGAQRQADEKDETGNNREALDGKHGKAHHEDEGHWNARRILGTGAAAVGGGALLWLAWKDCQRQVAENDPIDLGRSPNKDRQD
jgi:hypothetical protein